MTYIPKIKVMISWWFSHRIDWKRWLNFDPTFRFVWKLLQGLNLYRTYEGRNGIQDRSKGSLSDSQQDQKGIVSTIQGQERHMNVERLYSWAKSATKNNWKHPDRKCSWRPTYLKSCQTHLNLRSLHNQKTSIVWYGAMTGSAGLLVLANKTIFSWVSVLSLKAFLHLRYHNRFSQRKRCVATVTIGGGNEITQR